MRAGDVLALALRNTFRGGIKVRLCVLSLCIGICSVCSILSLGDAASGAVSAQIDQMGLGGIAFHTTDSAYRVDARDLSAVAQVSGVRAVMPLAVKSGYVWLKGQGGQAVVCGVDQTLDQVFSLNLLYGRLIGRQDVGGAAKVAVIDDAMAQSAYQRSNVVGKSLSLTVNGITETYTVVGIISSQKQGLGQMISSNIPNFIYIPHTALEAMTGDASADMLAVSCLADADTDTVAQKVTGRLEALNDVRFQSENLTRLSNGMKQITAIVSLFVTAVAGISILVGGFGVMNIMIAAVEARTREIGIYIALGAGRGTIVALFLLEAQAISLAGGVLGIALCRVFLGLAGTAGGYAIAVSGGALGLGLACAVACGTIFGVLPAFRASGLDPIEAIRLE